MMKQYFMYGVLISFQEYLDLNTGSTVEEVLENDNDDGIQGVFTGRNGDFMILGKILEHIEDDNDPHVVPELSETESITVKTTVNKRFNIHGDFQYYFIAKNNGNNKG